jgi:predicted amidohydrolase
MSPDGVLFTVRTEKNKPKADLAFWREAMKTRLSQAGYRVVSDSACAMKGSDGVLLQLAAPMGNQDWFYWIAFTLSPNGKRILVAEAAGESKRFLARRDAVRKAIAESGF